MRIRDWVLGIARRNKRFAIAAALVVPLLILALIIASIPALAAPPSLVPNTRSLHFTFESHVQAPITPTLPVDERARVLLQSILADPRVSFLPDAQLADVHVEGDAITVKLILPEAFLYGGLDPLVSDEINRLIIQTLYPLGGLRQFHVLALDPRDADRVFKPISYFLFERPIKPKESERVRVAEAVTPTRFLSGKAVYLSAGHGWYWNGNAGIMEWRTQRYGLPVSFNLVEDMNNAEVVNQYLIQYLRNAGADVWPVREHDMNTQEIIITHGSAAYAESGVWFTSTMTGYQGLNYHYALVVTTTATATATWTFTPTAAGRYAVYAWYLPGTNRAPDAQYLVAHDGGVTEVRVNQQVHGATWRYIGTFPFLANAPGRVMLTNQSATTNTVVIADAVRVGGGMGDQLGGGPPPSPGVSGKPRWEEAARYWIAYQGADPSIYQFTCTDYGVGASDSCQDVTARPNYAEWERSSSEDAVFVSWHTNASTLHNARGTESYIWDGGATPGSAELQAQIQNALVADIRAGWEAGWQNRGLFTADFGELRPLATMPGTLVEIAFHDQQQDTNALKDARFAQLTARAMYKGIVRYFAQKDGVTPIVLPEPPRNLIVRNSGPGQVTVAWRPPLTDSIGLLGDAATGYRVYTSGDGFGWDNGTAVTGTSFTLTGLAPNQLMFVRVTATNAGGESFPTAIAAARVAASGSAPVLIVYGYERIDRYMDVERCDAPSVNCPNQRIWIDQMNNQSYVVQHAQAISLPLDSALRGAIGSGDITLTDYGIVDWIAGQEQTPAPTPNGTSEVALTTAERNALTAFVNSGGSLFLSGAEVAFDLATNLNAAAFLAGTLRAQFSLDDANTFTVTPSASGIFSGLASFGFDDGSRGAYRVEYPDVLIATNGSSIALSYVGGTGGTAAIQYANGCQRVVYLGFTFETIYSASTRQAVMSRVMSFLGACLNLPAQATILSPASNGFYNLLPPINGTAGGGGAIHHVDVALVDAAQSLFFTGTGWVANQTWLSATGSVTWAFMPSVTLADGPYAVWARAWTASGLSSTVSVVSFTIDTIAPTAPTIITPTSGVTIHNPVTLVFTPAHDVNGVAGYTVQVDGLLYTTTFTTYPAGSLPVGAHVWSVRAFDLAGNTSDWTTATFSTDVFLNYLPIVFRDYAYTPPLTSCQELIVNGGFETQETWYSVSITKPTYVAAPTHGGLASLFIGYTSTANAPLTFSSIQQIITIPLTATATTLTLWRYPVSSDMVGDKHYVYVGPDQANLTQVWFARSNEQAWTPTTIDLTGRTGPLIILVGVYNDGINGVTALYLDNVSVQSCGP